MWLEKKNQWKILKLIWNKKDENNYDGYIKSKNFIFDGDIVNIQLVSDEISMNRSDEEIEIINVQLSHLRDRHARDELRLTKIQPSHPRDRMARRSRIPIKKEEEEKKI